MLYKLHWKTPIQSEHRRKCGQRSSETRAESQGGGGWEELFHISLPVYKAYIWTTVVSTFSASSRCSAQFTDTNI